MSKKKAVIIIASVISVVVLCGVITAGVMLSPAKGKTTDEFWLPTMQFDIEDTVIIEKQPDKDFTILNLTDVQYNDFLDVGQRKFTEDTVSELINKVKPDLITLTGDQVWAAFTKNSVKDFISFMDSFKIRWAPINGNHDGEGNVDLNWIADRYEESEYCLFRKGPNNIGGTGNYVINIMENGVIVHSLIMMDSGASRSYDLLSDEDKIVSYRLDENFELKKDENGNYLQREVGHDYEFISLDQIEWYKWNIDGIKQYNESKGAAMPESSLFIHIPLPEYYLGYIEYLLSGKDQSYGAFGALREDVCCPKVNSGMFDVLLEKGSTKYVFAGHDHTNDLSFIYKGIRLTYALKTGDRCSMAEGVNGGTVITVGKKVGVEHRYVG